MNVRPQTKNLRGGRAPPPGVWAGGGEGGGGMAWVRAPIYFPSMVMEMMPLSRAAQAALNRGRLPREVQFRVPPRANKVRGAAPGRRPSRGRAGPCRGF